MSENLEILNYTIIEEAKQLMGDRFPSIIKYFLEDTQSYAEEIEKNIGEKNFEGVMIAAHTIKSSAKQIGTERISECAKQIEVLSKEIISGKSGDHEEIARLYEELKEEIEAAKPELNSAIE